MNTTHSDLDNIAKIPVAWTGCIIQLLACIALIAYCQMITVLGFQSLPDSPLRIGYYYAWSEAGIKFGALGLFTAISLVNYFGLVILAPKMARAIMVLVALLSLAYAFGDLTLFFMFVDEGRQSALP